MPANLSRRARARFAAHQPRRAASPLYFHIIESMKSRDVIAALGALASGARLAVSHQRGQRHGLPAAECYTVSPVSAASAEDLIAIRTLLEDCGLPTSDLASARPEFVVIREHGRVVAAGALQRFGSSALLRSVAVVQRCRGSGLGHAVVLELERKARDARIERLILLTQSAAPFFARHGYEIIERSAAPAEVQGSEEFRSLCPSSATCMAKLLASSA